jgi:prepilin-type processing-associated H-X9-DG protein
MIALIPGRGKIHGIIIREEASNLKAERIHRISCPVFFRKKPAYSRKHLKRKPFTVLDLIMLILLGIVAFEIFILILGATINRGRRIHCMTNMKLMMVAVESYKINNGNYYLPAAWDLEGKNFHRWYGSRENSDAAFNFADSPLKTYLGTEEIAPCPSLIGFKVDESQDVEAACGGYGYNADYIGSGRGLNDGKWPVPEKCAQPARYDELLNPTKTVIFADSAKAVAGDDKTIIHHSFANPPQYQSWSWINTAPTCHFRHNGVRCNVAWGDGHLTSEDLGFYRDTFNHREMQLFIGYLGDKEDNNLFDRK